MGYYGLRNYACANPNVVLVNNLTVAIINSDAHSHVHKRGSYADYSPCHTLYNLRYALGLHNAKHDDLKRFQSRDDYHNYVSSRNVFTILESYYGDGANASKSFESKMLQEPINFHVVF